MTSRDFTKPWTYSDVQFRREGSKEGEDAVYANKVVLSMWSPVWEDMFRDTQYIASSRILLKGIVGIW